MKFGPVPVETAEGAILAHSEALPEGRLRKGTVLEAQDIERLRAAGLSEVTVARLEPGDRHEDQAALALARALVPDPAAAGLRIGPAATGRVNIHAEAPGILELDTARLQALNAIDPMITLATLPPWARCTERMMAATVKIIAYAVPETALREAVRIGTDSLRLRRPVIGEAALIVTQIDGEDGAKAHRVTRERLERLGIALAPLTLVPHEAAPLARAIAAAPSEAVLILTGSATSDIADTAPEALRLAGGSVTQFGMPVDPGNLLFFGEHRGRPVIGLPGCARSPALNGADWVIERLLCGVDLGPRDIAEMGVGGLLKEIPQRGRPREG